MAWKRSSVDPHRSYQESFLSPLPLLPENPRLGSHSYACDAENWLTAVLAVKLSNRRREATA